MKLKEARKKARLTQQAVADHLGIRQSAYHYWESERSRIDAVNLAKLAKLFNVSIDYLLEDESESEPQPESQRPLTPSEITSVVNDALYHAFGITPSDEMVELQGIYERASDETRKQLLSYARYLDTL